MGKKSRSKDSRGDKALEFHISSGIDVGLVKNKCGRKFSEEAIENILCKYKDYSDCYGCYIYSVKAGKGFTPIYVGSATRQTLGEEAFTSDKRLKCLQYMSEYGKGSLHITFVVPKDKIDSSMGTRRGRYPTKTIECLEKVLIAVAYRKNKHLMNKQNRCLSNFFINGALNSDAGRPREEVVKFKDMMGLRDKSIVVVKQNNR